MTTNPTAATIDREKLLPDLQRMIKALKADLLDRLGQSPDLDDKLRLDAFAPVERAGRTAQAYEVWRLDYLEQVAVAWVLACVFVRYMEDNGLIVETYLAGITPDRRRQAEDAQQAYLNSRPEDDTDRGYLLDVFRRVGSIPAARDLFAEGKTPLWALGPTADGARALLDAWRKIDPETGALVRSFRVEGGDTRFLGDLYQDLSEDVRKKYALLQTPDFVERFLLDHTLTPALDEFGLEAVRTIDPTCGSGHLVLGSFWRLFHEWARREPATEKSVLVDRALASSCGVDVNPFAVAITRFRLLVAAMQAEEKSDLRRAHYHEINIVCGDSLMHGDVFDARGFSQNWLPQTEPWADPIFAIEDPAGLQKLLGRQYHVVVGNPPYITVKDARIGDRYRARWKTCHRQYSLGVPFTERFFNLALAPDYSGRSGYVGMITANSFMKREFGKKLIEEFLPTIDLTHVIDTSGAYIPEHGTPTVILFGRKRPPVSKEIRAVLGIRSEPTKPEDPANGYVWKSILDHLAEGKSENEFISVTAISREVFGRHPWSLGGGGVAELREQIEKVTSIRLGNILEDVGFGAVTREDDAYQISESAARRNRISPAQILPLVEGEEIRDWAIRKPQGAIWPYDPVTLEVVEGLSVQRFLWPYRLQLSNRVAFGLTQIERGLSWLEYSMFFRERFRVQCSIAYASISTHNHFVFDRGGKIFKDTAPIIKLPKETTEDDFICMLGLLNCSTACFWMKQVFFPKGGSGIGRGITDEHWEVRYVHDGTKISLFPVLDTRHVLLPVAREMHKSASFDYQSSPIGDLLRATNLADELASRGEELQRHQARMVALQEELDWLCYRLYGLTEPFKALDAGGDEPYPDPPGLELGERPFEIAMARQMAAGELQTSWFERHGSTPITEIPGHWPESYRALVQRRLDAIRDDPNIALIERPEYKRRWNREPWDDQVHRALKSWLLDRLESDRYWPDPAHEPPELASCAALAERAAGDADFLQVAALYAGRPDFPLAKLVEELITAESVPLLPVLRYKETGKVKRKVWERTWDLQRREDNNEDVGPIPVPPKYASADFLNSDLWRLRGKLDVPKERFVSYPHASRDGDPSLVVGWAGWDHLRQAQALTAYYERMKSREGWTPDRLVPLLAGLDQLVPWLIQWHNELDPEYDLRMGDYYRDFVQDEAQALGFTLDQLKGWTPPAKVRTVGRRKKG